MCGHMHEGTSPTLAWAGVFKDSQAVRPHDVLEQHRTGASTGPVRQAEEAQLESAVLCRVAVCGRTYEGTSPTQAWAGVFEGPAKPRGFSGPRLFGPSLDQVAAVLQTLPGAAHCHRYRGWKGRVPTPPPLVSFQLACSSGLHENASLCSVDMLSLHIVLGPATCVRPSELSKCVHTADAGGAAADRPGQHHGLSPA